MRKIIIALAVVLVAGCATPVPEVKIVEVPKPIPFCPAPPTVPFVPPMGLMVPLLQDQDLNDPGKIAQAYKHDMMFYRAMSQIYYDVIQQYNKTSQDWTVVNDKIDQLYKEAAVAREQAVRNK